MIKPENISKESAWPFTYKITCEKCGKAWCADRITKNSNPLCWKCIKERDRLRRAEKQKDVVKVVRCGSCRYKGKALDGRGNFGCINRFGLVVCTEQSYCSYGEREDETE